MAHTPKISRLVLPDSKALSLFENDPCVKIIEKRKELPGYELYIVEQWATSREHLSSVIITFTGLIHHKIKVYVLELPEDEKDWSDRLRLYVQNTSKAPARRKETSLGTLMVTNLSSFASTLNVVNIPGGDYDDYRDIFVVNENLKRLGCSGRAGLNLAEPSGAATAKFRQLYYTSENVPIVEAVVELVRLCQVALILYAQLAREYTDGLLCDVTLNAVKDWWTQIGSEHFNADPSDRGLGPATVAALIGLLQGARIRLQALSCPIGKDIFELRVTKRAIEAFQKWYRLDRTRRFDAKTLDRLHSLTVKYVNSKEWMVPRAVKSTIPQLGKGGEMVMGMVSNKDKAGIGEIETLDMAILAATATGDTAKWLWQGKRGKTTFEDALSRLSSEDEVLSGEEPMPKASRKRDIVLDRMPSMTSRTDHFYNNAVGSTTSLDASDRDQSMPKHVFKSVTGRLSGAKSGIGRKLDSVGIHGFRGHSSKLSKDVVAFGDIPSKNVTEEVRSASGETQASATNDESMKRARTPPVVQRPPTLTLPQDVISQPPSVTGEELVFSPGELEPEDKQPFLSNNEPQSISLDSFQSIASGPREIFTRSISYDMDAPNLYNADNPLPRALSYGDISDALYQTHDFERELSHNTLEGQLASETYLSELAIIMKKRLARLTKKDLVHTQQVLQEIQDSGNQVTEDLEDVDKQYFSLLGKYDSQQHQTMDTISNTRTALGDTLMRIEGVMSKLEYELNMLESKVEDVEDGVADFEEQVVALEARARALEPKEKKPESLPWKLVRVVFGLA